MSWSLSDSEAIAIAKNYDESPRGREMAAVRAEREREAAEIEATATA